MQTYYGFTERLNLKDVDTPYAFKKQFVVYSNEDNYPRKSAVDAFLRRTGSPAALPHYVLISRTTQPYTLAKDFVPSARANFHRFMRLLRVIKPNSAFVRVEAFHTGSTFGSATRYGVGEIPIFLLESSNQAEILQTDLDLLNEVMNRIARLKFDQAHRINNFYGYLEHCITGETNHRIIWMFIALESLFHLWDERRDTKPIAKRAAYFLEPTDAVQRKKTYDLLLDAAKQRGTLVHGGVVRNQEIKDMLIKLEPVMWGIGKLLLTGDKKRIKLFSSLDPKLANYFKRAENQPF